MGSINNGTHNRPKENERINKKNTKQNKNKKSLKQNECEGKNSENAIEFEFRVVLTVGSTDSECARSPHVKLKLTFFCWQSHLFLFNPFSLRRSNDSSIRCIHALVSSWMIAAAPRNIRDGLAKSFKIHFRIFAAKISFSLFVQLNEFSVVSNVWNEFVMHIWMRDAQDKLSHIYSEWPQNEWN